MKSVESDHDKIAGADDYDYAEDSQDEARLHDKKPVDDWREVYEEDKKEVNEEFEEDDYEI